MKSALALITLLHLMTLTCNIAAAEPTKLQKISTVIEDVYQDLDSNIGPGCAVGFAQNGQLIYERQFGMANLEHNITINADTVFRTGSTSKQFVAASLALLSLQGKLDLDADIRIPSCRIYPDYGTVVTIRQMINHSSGIPDVYSIMSAVYGDEDGNFYPSEKP